MKRLLALVVALGLVAGAVVLRQWMDGDELPAFARPSDDEPFRLTCATELANVCEQLRDDDAQLRVLVEDAGATSDRLSALDTDADPGFDAWLVAGPWGPITEDNRAFRGVRGEVLGESSRVLARSPAVLVSSAAGRDALAQDCEPKLSWRCVGQAGAGVSVGMPDPDRGDGLTVLAAAAASFFDATDYAANDFTEPGFTAWFDRVTRLSAQTSLGRQSPLEAALTRQGLFNVVGALEAQSTRLLADRPGWATTYPLPVVTADVTLLPPLGGSGDDLLGRWGEQLGDALADQGWRIDASVPEGAVELPEDTGLPAPGVLQRLRELW